MPVGECFFDFPFCFHRLPEARFAGTMDFSYREQTVAVSTEEISTTVRNLRGTRNLLTAMSFLDTSSGPMP